MDRPLLRWSSCIWEAKSPWLLPLLLSHYRTWIPTRTSRPLRLPAAQTRWVRCPPSTCTATSTQQRSAQLMCVLTELPSMKILHEAVVSHWTHSSTARPPPCGAYREETVTRWGSWCSAELCCSCRSNVHSASFMRYEVLWKIPAVVRPPVHLLVTYHAVVEAGNVPALTEVEDVAGSVDGEDAGGPRLLAHPICLLHHNLLHGG